MSGVHSLSRKLRSHDAHDGYDGFSILHAPALVSWASIIRTPVIPVIETEKYFNSRR
jgi:hypothetical protein